MWIRYPLQKQLPGSATERAFWLIHRCDALDGERVEHIRLHVKGVIEAHNGNMFGHAHADLLAVGDHADRRKIAGGDDGGRNGSQRQKLPSSGDAGVDIVVSLHNHAVLDLKATRSHTQAEVGEPLACGGG